MLAVIVLVPVFAASASADNTVTITGTQVLPVPPASNFAGNSGGDGWAIALSPEHVYNVFHHQSPFYLSCHTQATAAACWNPTTQGRLTQPKGDGGSFDFATPGQAGLWLDQQSGKVYAFATRDDGVGGVVCADPSTVNSPGGLFCGFTQLTGTNESAGAGGSSGISNFTQIGSKLYAFNYVSGRPTGAEDKILCFDLQTLAACAGQPFSAPISSGSVSVGSFPAPAAVGIANRLFIPINVNGADELDCFDPSKLSADNPTGACAGWNRVAINFSYIDSNGAAFPLLDSAGNTIGLCLPSDNVPCYDFNGSAHDFGNTSVHANLVSALVRSNDPWNGPALVLGPRVYVPNGNAPGGGEVTCFDYNLGQQCAGFPKSFQNLSYLYTVNADPQRPTCIWVNSDSQLSGQIQNFDAFTGGKCGEGPIRVRADSFIVNAPQCLPGNYTSLQVTEPAPTAYQSGSVSFQDPSGNAIAGASDVPLDSTGTASLTGLKLDTAAGLPQFLITLNTGDNPRPGQVVVKLTWQGNPDPSCLGPVFNNTPPTGGGTPAGPPPESDVGVTVSGPVFARVGNTVTFTDTLKNNGKNTATGVLYQSPLPAGASFVSAKISNGNSCVQSTATVTCYVGTLNSGSSATVTIVYTANQTGTLTHSVNVQADYDTNLANNVASASTPIIAQDAAPPAPPKPAAPGTFNAITTGTVLVNGQPVTPDQVFLLKAGDVVDVTNGTITITDFDGGFGTFGNVQPSPQRRTQSLHSAVAAGGPVAVFRIDQAAQVGAGVTLTLVQGDFSVCTTPRRLSAANQTPVRQLWGKAKGNFTTTGRYSAATIRGTIWLEQDRCDGSFTSAIDDVVSVQDLVKNTTVTLNPGQTYLAQPKAPFKPPAVKKHKKTTKGQTAATIRKHGLVWANQLFVSQAQFTAWLERRGQTWQHFAATNPKFAEALASRK